MVIIKLTAHNDNAMVKKKMIITVVVMVIVNGVKLTADMTVGNLEHTLGTKVWTRQTYLS